MTAPSPAAHGWQIDYSRLPDYMRDATRRYIEDGQPTGDFLAAVISNDLFEAVVRADDTNRPALLEWVRFFYNDAPRDCWGSEEKRQAWLKSGGLNGHQQGAS